MRPRREGLRVGRGCRRLLCCNCKSSTQGFGPGRGPCGECSCRPARKRAMDEGRMIASDASTGRGRCKCAVLSLQTVGVPPRPSTVTRAAQSQSFSRGELGRCMRLLPRAGRAAHLIVSTGTHVRASRNWRRNTPHLPAPREPNRASLLPAMSVPGAATRRPFPAPLVRANLHAGWSKPGACSAGGGNSQSASCRACTARIATQLPLCRLQPSGKAD